jgi:cytochrome c biogenesis protein CcmG/thiol:disulfide interchange protein DsbE
MKRLLFALPVLILGVISGFFWRGLDLDPTILPSAMIDRPVPDFTLPALRADGRGLATADFQGAPKIVNVFASWCVPCRAEHSIIARLAAMPGVAVFGLNYKDDAKAALTWLDELGDPYARIGADRAGRVAIDWGVYGVPETYLVDGAGRIRYRHVGPLDAALLAAEILPRWQALQPGVK